MREILSVVYLRAICAVFIVLFHAAGRDDITGSGNSKIEQVFSLGASRVDIFFVISGFVLFIATVSRGGEAPGAFLLRRIMRIAPLYWLFTLALAFAALGFPKLFPNLSPTAQDIALSLFFVPHFSASKPDKIWPILVQGWALTYEVIFYLVFAVALFARRTKWLPIIASLFIGLVLAGLIFQPTSAVGLTVTDPVLLEFLGGAAFGQLWAEGMAFIPDGIVEPVDIGAGRIGSWHLGFTNRAAMAGGLPRHSGSDDRDGLRDVGCR